jgi:hypothetical protein
MAPAVVFKPEATVCRPYLDTIGVPEMATTGYSFKNDVQLFHPDLRRRSGDLLTLEFARQGPQTHFYGWIEKGG